MYTRPMKQQQQNEYLYCTVNVFFLFTKDKLHRWLFLPSGKTDVCMNYSPVKKHEITQKWCP